jgi:hypothetical protein
MPIPTIEEVEEKRKKINFAELAAQALISAQTPEVSPELLQAIPGIDAAGRRAMSETDYPSSYHTKMPNSASEENTPESPRTQRAAAKTPIISKHSTSAKNIYDLSSDKIGTSPRKPVDRLAAFAYKPQALDVLEKATEMMESQLSQIRAKSLDENEENPLSADEIAEAAEDIGEASLTPMEEIIEKTVVDANKLLRKKTNNFPNVAKEILSLGLKMESFKTEQLELYKKESDEHRAKIQQLLTLSGHLDTLPTDKATHNLKEAILDKLTEPEKGEMEKCMKEVFPGGSLDISKEVLAGVKVSINDRMALHKTDMTNILTTKMTVIIHNLQMMTQIMQNALRLDERLHGTILRNSTGR